MPKRIVVTILFLLVFVAVVAFARGYRFDISNKNITSTGLISITSNPRSAKVSINGEVRGVTDLTVNAAPGAYTITITKEGYFPWTKQVVVEKEVVYSLDAFLYPVNPSLTPLTNIGVAMAKALGPGGERTLLFSPKETMLPGHTSLSATSEAKEAKIQSGLFIFDSTNWGVSFFPKLTLIAQADIFPDDFDYQKVEVVFSPDYSQAVLFHKPVYKRVPLHENLDYHPTYSRPDRYENAYLLSLDQKNTSLLDISGSVDVLLDAWIEQKGRNLTKIISSYQPVLAEFLRKHTKIVDISSDKTKILYEATASAALAQIISPPLIGANQTPQTRKVEAGRLYVYDLKEDRNYQLEFDRTLPYPIFHPNSRNIVYNLGNRISISDYDGRNEQVVYSGPYDKSLVSISADGRLLILSNLNPQLNALPDLYAVGIR
jgi:hypothetical protein